MTTTGDDFLAPFRLRVEVKVSEVCSTDTCGDDLTDGPCFLHTNDLILEMDTNKKQTEKE